MLVGALCEAGARDVNDIAASHELICGAACRVASVPGGPPVQSHVVSRAALS